MQTTILPPRKALRRAKMRRIQPTLPFIARRNEEEPLKDDCTCGRWGCRRCSCRKYDGKEEGGYKCNKCGHYYEDHKTI